jgi:lambda family phage portal protein
VAYHLRPDYSDWPGTIMPSRSERVPAAEMIHIYRIKRPGQMRDVSWLAPILWTLRDLGNYERALLRKAEIEACLSVVVTGDGEQTLTTENGHLLRDANGAAVEDIQPGLILYRNGGGSVDTIAPSGGGSHTAFAKRALEAAAVGAGLTYDQVSGDLSQANYSSLRAGKIEFRRLLEQVQYTVIIPRLIERVAARFHELGAVRGMWQDGDAERKHVPPAPEMVDPLKDTMALLTQIRAGFVPPQDGPGQFGYDADEVMVDLVKWQSALDDGGVILDTDPRRVAKSGAAHDAAQNAAIEIAATGAAFPTPPADEASPAARGAADERETMAMVLEAVRSMPPPVVHVAAPVVNAGAVHVDVHATIPKRGKVIKTVTGYDAEGRITGMSEVEADE